MSKQRKRCVLHRISVYQWPTKRRRHLSRDGMNRLWQQTLTNLNPWDSHWQQTKQRRSQETSESTHNQRRFRQCRRAWLQSLLCRCNRNASLSIDRCHLIWPASWSLRRRKVNNRWHIVICLKSNVRVSKSLIWNEQVSRPATTIFPSHPSRSQPISSISLIGFSARYAQETSPLRLHADLLQQWLEDQLQIFHSDIQQTSSSPPPVAKQPHRYQSTDDESDTMQETRLTNVAVLPSTRRPVRHVRCQSSDLVRHESLKHRNRPLLHDRKQVCPRTASSSIPRSDLSGQSLSRPNHPSEEVLSNPGSEYDNMRTDRASSKRTTRVNCRYSQISTDEDDEDETSVNRYYFWIFVVVCVCVCL